MVFGNSDDLFHSLLNVRHARLVLLGRQYLSHVFLEKLYYCSS
jgi:hypothetical protein